MHTRIRVERETEVWYLLHVLIQQRRPRRGVDDAREGGCRSGLEHGINERAHE